MELSRMCVHEAAFTHSSSCFTEHSATWEGCEGKRRPTDSSQCVSSRATTNLPTSSSITIASLSRNKHARCHSRHIKSVQINLNFIQGLWKV